MVFFKLLKLFRNFKKVVNFILLFVLYLNLAFRYASMSSAQKERRRVHVSETYTRMRKEEKEKKLFTMRTYINNRYTLYLRGAFHF